MAKTPAPLAAIIALVLVGCGQAAPAPSRTPSPVPASDPAMSSAIAVSTPVATTPQGQAIKDGEAWIAYNWGRPSDGRWAIFLVRPDGSDAHQILADLPDDQRAPSWSPDGTKLAFINRGPSDQASPEGTIWLSNADGSGARRTFDGGDDCVAVFHPAWSPDGTKLAFVCYPDEKRSSLAVLDLASLTMTTLATVTAPEFMDSVSSWSPDGATITFDVIQWDPTGTFMIGSLVATVPSGGGTVHRLTAMDAFMAHPSWDPKGGEIVMNSYDIANGSELFKASNLYAIKPDGTGQRQITHSSVDGTMRIGVPRWDPDGSKIWVTAMAFAPDGSFLTAHLGFVDSAGGEPTIISEAFDGKYQDSRPTR